VNPFQKMSIRLDYNNILHNIHPLGQILKFINNKLLYALISYFISFSNYY